MPDLFPPDPTRDGAYSVLRPDGRREDIHWSHAAFAWFPADGSIIDPIDMGEHGYSDPRYVETEPTPTLDDRQTPVWALKEPGTLAHRDGWHFINWRRDWASFHVSFVPLTDEEDAHDLGEFPTPELAKAAAETHAAWCKEFGL